MNDFTNFPGVRSLDPLPKWKGVRRGREEKRVGGREERRDGLREGGEGGEGTEVWEGREGKGDVCIHPSGGSEALSCNPNSPKHIELSARDGWHSNGTRRYGAFPQELLNSGAQEGSCQFLGAQERRSRAFPLTFTTDIIAHHTVT
jgi:hypothetical protein